MKKTTKKKNPIYALQSSVIWKEKQFKNIFYNNFKMFFNIGQKLGIHIVPNHFYYPVPDTRFLTDRIFSQETQHIGIDINEKEQLNLLSIFASKYKEEFNNFPRYPTNIPYQYYTTNGNFKSIDGEVLYCMVRHFKPKKIIEIGSGYSTFCSAQAIRKNKELDEKYNCELIAIEPFPNKRLRKGFPGLTKLIPNKLETVPLDLFIKLKENDILFIDSSHIINIGNDVQYEYLEILPRLSSGVIVHIHDIFFPAEYPKEWVIDLLRFYNEQYILQAFLTFNNAYKILWAAKFMHMHNLDILEGIFESFKRDRIHLKKSGPTSDKLINNWPIEWPTSFWIQKIK